MFDEMIAINPFLYHTLVDDNNRKYKKKFRELFFLLTFGM